MRTKQAGWLVTALLLTGLTGGCQPYRTSARSDPTTDFAAYRTYAWMPHVDSIASRRDSAGYDDDIVQARIHAAVGQALEARGFRLDANGPDILLQYHLGSRDVERVVAEPMSTYYPAPKPSVFDGEIPDIVRGMFKKYPP